MLKWLENRSLLQKILFISLDILIIAGLGLANLFYENILIYSIIVMIPFVTSGILMLCHSEKHKLNRFIDISFIVGAVAYLVVSIILTVKMGNLGSVINDDSEGLGTFILAIAQLFMYMMMPLMIVGCIMKMIFKLIISIIGTTKKRTSKWYLVFVGILCGIDVFILLFTLIENLATHRAFEFINLVPFILLFWNLMILINAVNKNNNDNDIKEVK